MGTLCCTQHGHVLQSPQHHQPHEALGAVPVHPDAVSWLLSKLHRHTAAGAVPSGTGMLQTSWSDDSPF